MSGSHDRRGRDRPARVGVVVKPHHASYPELRAAAVTADELGADIIFGWDHFHPLHGDIGGRNLEAWTVLAAYAEVTHRAELGLLVASNGYRNPDLHADMARTVDHISARDGMPGRLIFGIGAGWSDLDYAEYGYEFGTAPDRLRKLAIDLPRIRARWEKLNPPPTRRIPILVGGGGEKVTLRIAARHADIWHAAGSIETLAHKNDVLDEWCAVEGRDPHEIERSADVPVRAMSYPRRASEDHIGRAEALHEIGTRLFVVGVESAADWQFDHVRELLAWRDRVNAAWVAP
jgi:probable F420-dependent oxidoreductase